MRRWEWGRVHHGAVHRGLLPGRAPSGESRNLWITCRDGRPESIREAATIEEIGPRRNIFGVRDSDDV